MDEGDDEQSLGDQPAGSVFSSAGADAGPPDPCSPEALWPKPDQEAPLDASPNTYGPGDHGQGDYSWGNYDPDNYGSGGYVAGGYGPAESWPAQRLGPKLARKIVAMVAVALVLVSAGAGVGIAYVTRSAGSSAAGLATLPAGQSLTTSQIAAAVDPAVVDIDTNLGEGTGMIATSNGEIITNNHVIDGASSIKVSINNGGTHVATVLGTDARADVAVLQLKGVSGLPTVKFANSSAVSVGNAVVAIGNAGGQGFPSSVTSGAVTALGRTIVASDSSGTSETLTGMIQMDALIEPGNSGGPLVDATGGVVGMDTAAARDDGATPMSFALPINRVLQIVNEVKDHKAGAGIVIGVVAYLGVAGQAVSIGGSGQSIGVDLTYVDLGGPAALAGIQEGDVIVAFDGHPTSTLAELASLIHALRPGDRAEVRFLSLAGTSQTTTVILAAAPPA